MMRQQGTYLFENYNDCKIHIKKYKDHTIIVALHNLKLGPAIGGVRILVDVSIDEAKIVVSRLAKSMTNKASIAGINSGGGKAVICLTWKLLPNQNDDDVVRAKKEKRMEEIFLGFGRFVQSFNGDYITAPDVGTNSECMQIIKRETKHVVGIIDPSPMTAVGTIEGMKMCLLELYGNKTFDKRYIVIQGVGKVGEVIAKQLSVAGARITITDTEEEKLLAVSKKINAMLILDGDISRVDGDIFAPCAIGPIVTDQTILWVTKNFNAVCGCANNQLEDEKKHGRIFKEKGKLYAPDFVVNCGGLIAVYREYYPTQNDALTPEEKWLEIEAYVRVQVRKQMSRIFEESKRDLMRSTHEIAEQIAFERLGNM